MEIVAERVIGAQRLLQVVQREAGIGGQKGARGVDGFEHDFTAAAAAHAEAQDAEQFAGSGRFAVVDLDGARLAGQLFELARLREVAMHQLEVLGLFQRFVVVRGLIAVGDDVTRQRRQNVGRVGIGGQGGHAGEGAQRTGDQCGSLVGGRFGGRRGAQGYGFAARGTVGLKVGVRGGAVAGQQVEHGEAACHCSGAGGIAAIAQSGEQLAVGLARAGIAVAVQEFGIRGQCGHIVGAGLGGAGECVARAQGIARGFHLLNRACALFSEDRRGSGR